ncbi:hypothetical protein ABEB36_009447 [Hypothenemus hampei]|uniref:carbonyl reductase (NADPH) n=1 Tax=Hypothenemus hampei TaxID=57062 RepID=A0ABD1EGG6_HYPHA
MWVISRKRKVLVTGANKGIGYAIVKGLCERFDGDVYLTSRDPVKGQEAVTKLKALGLNPLFHQLDITDQISIDNFKKFIKEEYGGIDILINNAGVYANQSLTMGEQAEYNVNVNYFGTLNLSSALFPLLRNNAHVVNVTSSVGRLQRIPSMDIQKKFKEPDLTIENLSKLMKEYIKTAKENRHVEEGWGSNAYGVSKVGLTALTMLQQKFFDQQYSNKNLSINAVHPGWIQTDMNKTATTSPENGAKSSLFAALDSNVKGQYIWNDCRIVDWAGPLPQRM